MHTSLQGYIPPTSNGVAFCDTPQERRGAILHAVDGESPLHGDFLRNYYF